MILKSTSLYIQTYFVSLYIPDMDTHDMSSYTSDYTTQHDKFTLPNAYNTCVIPSVLIILGVTYYIGFVKANGLMKWAEVKKLW